MLRRFPALLLLACGSYAGDLQTIADQARTLPPEFAADVLLKLIASPLPKDARWKRGVIEDAFRSAAHAEVPYRMQGPSAAVGPQFNARLEALTLQTRAVDAMAPIDPQRALSMFREIVTPALPNVSCQEALTPELSSYYQLAGGLFVTAFSPEQRAKGVDIAFLRETVSAIASPSQVVPALKMLSQVALRPGIRSELMAVFSTALDRIDGGSREFAASEPLLVSAAVPEMHELSFMPSLRAYIVRHAKGPRCSDTIRTKQLTESASQFNKLLTRIDPAATLFHPITVEESAPLRDEGTYSTPLKAPSEHAAKVSAALGALRQTQSSTPEWTSRYMELWALMESWKPAEEAPPEAYSLLILTDFSALLAVTPDKAAMTRAIHFVEQQYDTPGSHLTWFVELRMISDHAQDGPWLTEQLVQSRNPAVSVYGQLKRLLGAG